MNLNLKKSRSGLFVLASLLVGLLSMGASDCSGESMYKSCTQAEDMAYQLNKTANTLETYTIFYQSQPAFEHLCSKVDKLLYAELDGYIAFVNKSAVAAFAETKTTCLEKEKREVCRPQPRSSGNDFCQMRTFCKKSQTDIISTKDGYNDALQLSKDLGYLKQDVAYACGQVAQKDVTNAAKYFRQAVTRIRGDIHNTGEIVSEKSGCADWSRSQDNNNSGT